MSENGEIYTAGKNFTLPPALTALTNSTSVVVVIMAMMVLMLMMALLAWLVVLIIRYLFNGICNNEAIRESWPAKILQFGQKSVL